MPITSEQVWSCKNTANSLARGFKITGYDAEDLTTEALLHLHKRVEEANKNGEVVENFKHWSTYIMKRKILDIRRGTLMNATNGKEEKLPWHMSTETANSHKPDGSSDSLSGLMSQEERDSLAFAVKQLHADDQQVVKHVLAGTKDEESASRCGCGLSAYHMRKSRVIQKLRRLMVSLT